MGCEADAVAIVFAEDLSQGDKGLNVAAGADNLNDNVERRGRWGLGGAVIGRRRGGGPGFLLAGL